MSAGTRAPVLIHHGTFSWLRCPRCGAHEGFGFGPSTTFTPAPSGRVQLTTVDPDGTARQSWSDAADAPNPEAGERSIAVLFYCHPCGRYSELTLFGLDGATGIAWRRSDPDEDTPPVGAVMGFA